MEITDQILQKWSVLIDAAKNYWVDSKPTGLSDSEFDTLESKAAVEDGFFVRDYVFQTFLKGTKAKNKYIEKIKKFKVNGKMIDAMKATEIELGVKLYYDLKYDGSSIAIYLDPKTGRPKKLITVGNLNLDNDGVDQTWKLLSFLPKSFPKGIVAIQCEALIDTTRLSDIDPEKARQKANGLINSKYCDSEVSNLLTLRAYRYYTDDSQEGQMIRATDYRDVLGMFQTVRAKTDGHILFAPAQIWTLKDLEKNPEFCETDKVVTDTGTFLADGWVCYNQQGICQRALKFAGAGSGTEAIKTKVLSIQWNDQSSKGKDSWSANVIVEPVTLKGCVIKKPSAGSVSKLIKNNITPGATVGIVLANSTIPMVGEVFSTGNGDYQWPTCECGYKLGSSDVYGSLLKCGNPMCTTRLERMKTYVDSIQGISDLDLNKLLVIDRFKWENTQIDLKVLIGFVHGGQAKEYYEYLNGFLKTDLQKKNLNLVWQASYKVLYDKLH